MTVPKREGNQQNPTSARGARSKSGAAPSSGVKPKHHTMLDLIKQPKDWVRAYATRMREPQNWWPEFLPLYWECASELPLLCIASGQETGCGFQASHSPSQKHGLGDLPPSLSALCHNNFLPPWNLKGSWDICEMRKEKILALTKALQSYSEWSGGSYSMMCSTARSLLGCMANLIQFEEEDILEIPLLESTDDLPIAALTLEEETTLLS